MMIRRRFGFDCVRCASAGIALAMLLTLPLSAAGPKFLQDDPIAREPDAADASHVRPFPIHLSWDRISSLFVKEPASSHSAGGPRA